MIYTYSFRSPEHDRTLAVAVDTLLVDLMAYPPKTLGFNPYEAFALDLFTQKMRLTKTQARAWEMTDITPQLELFPDDDEAQT